MRSLVISLFALAYCMVAVAQDFQSEARSILSRADLSPRSRIAKIDSLYNLDQPSIEKHLPTLQGIVTQFIEQHKDSPDYPIMAMCNSRDIAQILSYHNSQEAFHIEANKALELAKQVEACAEVGHLHIVLADAAIRNGDQKQSLKHYLKAIEIMSALNTRDTDRTVSRCYYLIANNFLNVDDMTSIQEYMREIKALSDKYDGEHHIINYDYYSLLSAHYAHRCSTEGNSLRDSMIYAERMALRNYYKAREDKTIPSRTINDIVPSWNYYNIALAYDMFSDRPQIDSIAYYIDRAAEVREWNPNPMIQLEVDISLTDMRAWIHYYKEEYSQAEEYMFKTLELIDRAEALTPNSIRREKCQAYQFLVDLYEQQGNYRKALQYHKLLEESNSELFNLEKNRALRDIEARHQVEKKEAAIAQLQEQNRTSRRMMWYTLSIAVALLVALVLLAIIFRLHRQNIERQLYEKALENEIMRESNEALRHDTASQGLVDKLKITIVNSSLTSTQKERYIANLNTIDFARAAAIFSSADTLTQMDRRYILCFLADIAITDLGTIFNVETASIYTVRYRIKKKFSKDITLPF